MREREKRNERTGHEYRGKTADKHRHKSTTGSPGVEMDGSR